MCVQVEKMGQDECWNDKHFPVCQSNPILHVVLMLRHSVNTKALMLMWGR